MCAFERSEKGMEFIMKEILGENRIMEEDIIELIPDESSEQEIDPVPLPYSNLIEDSKR